MLFKSKSLAALCVVALIAISQFASAQCLNPAWSGADAPYALNDVVSNDGKDWICTNAGQGHWEPSGGAGHFGWSEISDPCAATTSPTLAATTTAGIWCRTAFVYGNITSNGGAAITQRGAVYSALPNPDLSDSVIVDDYATTGIYEGLLEDLAPETTYYTRSFATNSEGTEYGDQTSFTTDADVDCSDCRLACDKTSSLLNPATWPGIITTSDTICITEDFTMADNIICRGMIKICNDAQVTLSGSITMQGEGDGFEGQIVYEGCDEKFIGTGSYTGYRTPDNSENDSRQMLSYCSTCNNSDRSQFLANELTIAWWAAGCRPESSLLPVELGGFNSSSYKNNAVLTWNTFSEIDNDYFQIQVSTDGNFWMNTGMVQGAGTSSEVNNYVFIDENLNPGVYYYRLKQIDFDGSFHYSNVRALQLNTEEEPTYFNAFQNENNLIEVQAAVNGFGEAMLLDASGRVLETITFISASKSGTQLTFNAGGLATGIYYVNLVSANAFITRKVIITK